MRRMRDVTAVITVFARHSTKFFGSSMSVESSHSMIDTG